MEPTRGFTGQRPSVPARHTALTPADASLTPVFPVRRGQSPRHIGARADLNVITAELVDQVKVLDGITRYRFGDDPEVMAEWKAVRRVPGQPQAEGTPPAGQGVVPPTSGAGGSIAPAA